MIGLFRPDLVAWRHTLSSEAQGRLTVSHLPTGGAPEDCPVSRVDCNPLHLTLETLSANRERNTCASRFYDITRAVHGKPSSDPGWAVAQAALRQFGCTHAPKCTFFNFADPKYDAARSKYRELSSAKKDARKRKKVSAAVSSAGLIDRLRVRVLELKATLHDKREALRELDVSDAGDTTDEEPDIVPRAPVLGQDCTRVVESPARHPLYQCNFCAEPPRGSTMIQAHLASKHGSDTRAKAKGGDSEEDSSDEEEQPQRKRARGKR
jgi:hypothetical protein